MKDLIRSFLPQWVINYFYHLPMALLANIYNGFPTRGLTVIGVTGTDGKTTTVNMIYQILKESGKKTSMVSTINAVIGGKSYDIGFHVTSPDPFMMQKFAKQALENGDEYLVMEVTSHALDQFRFWGIKFEVGVITNITHEHLDYHKTLKNYRDIKFKLIKNAKYTIINNNLLHVRKNVSKQTGVISFGMSHGDLNQKNVNLKLQVSGEYNIENALAALAVAKVLGINQNQAKTILENFTGLVGRMEEVKNHRGIKIFIDFAHTPNALEQVLRTLCTQASPLRSEPSGSKTGRLIAVIGAEGFRDIGKREMMGEIAQKLADVVVVTAVDPRGQLDVINQQITAGAKKAGGILNKNLFVVDDREEAIKFAINMVRKNDVVGVFGKGHEKSMNLSGRNEIPWSDRTVVEKALKS